MFHYLDEFSEISDRIRNLFKSFFYFLATDLNYFGMCDINVI